MRQCIALIVALLIISLAFAPLIVPLPDTTPTHTIDPTPPTTTPTTTPAPTYTVIAAFDLDDTLLHSSPAFNKANHPTTGAFWHNVNGITPAYCTPLTTGTTILKAHQYQDTKAHTKVYTYIITARPNTNTKALTTWLIATYHVHGVYYTGKTSTTPKQNKATILKALALKHSADPEYCYYYGDSDSDIKAGIEAGYTTTRITRPPFSNYKRSNNPGTYNEPIIKWNQY